MKKLLPLLIAIACCAAIPLALVWFVSGPLRESTFVAPQSAAPKKDIGAIINEVLREELLDPGDPAPAFSFVSTDGKTVNSNDLRGKVVVLTSAGAWCPSCVVEALQFAAVYAQYKDRPVEFITIDIDPRDSTEFINEFRKENVTPWHYAQAKNAQQLIDDYDLAGFEITYVIDKGGVIRYKDPFITNADELEKAIKPLL